MKKNKKSLFGELKITNVLFMIYTLICIDSELLHKSVYSIMTSGNFLYVIGTTLGIIIGMGAITSCLSLIKKNWARKWIWDSVRHPLWSTTALTVFIYYTDKCFFGGITWEFITSQENYGLSGVMIWLGIITGTILLGALMTAIPLYTNYAVGETYGPGTTYEYVGSTTWTLHHCTLITPLGDMRLQNRFNQYESGGKVSVKKTYCFFNETDMEQD